MNYVPTKLTPSSLAALLSLRGELVTGAYLLLCDLGGHMATGWVGSRGRLVEEYHRRTGRRPCIRGLGRALDRLADAGLLSTSPAPSGLTCFRLLGGGGNTQGVGEIPMGETPTKGGGNTQGSWVKHPPPLHIGEERRENAAAARACPTLSSSSNYNEGLLSRLEPLGLSPQRASSLLSEVGAEEVERQLTLWPHRTEQERGWARVPGGAFVALCRQRAPEPESVRAARRADEENRAWQEAMRRAKEERVTREEYERAKEGAA